jgi:hypothetical protein
MLTRIIPLFFFLSLASCGGGGGGGSTPQVSVPQNASPILSAIGNKQILEGSNVSIASVSASDSDGDSLSFTLAGPDSSSFLLSENQNITFVTIPDFENPEDSDQNNVYSLTVRVSDGRASDEETINIEVIDAFDGRVVDGPVSDSVVRVINQGGDILAEIRSDEGGFWIVSEGVDESASQITALGGTDTATGVELSGAVFISDVPTGLLSANINALTSIIASTTQATEKDDVLTRLGVTMTPNELLSTDFWADAANGDVTAQALQRLNYQANVLLSSVQVIISSLSSGDPDGISAVNAWGRAIINARPSDPQLSLAEPDVVKIILQDAVSTQIPADEITDSLITALAEVVSDVNTVLGDEALDPTSETAIGASAISQLDLRNLTAQVFSGEIDEASFVEGIDPVNLFADIPVDVSIPDSDADGLADSIDPDDDNDDVRDNVDAFPLDPTETVDTDGDGIGNNADTDDDGDGALDIDDAFPLDPSETTDTDGDGIGNNADTDDDGDGVEDSEDAFPLDPTETVDTDGDGIGNNADTDDDGDGALDIDDAFPLDPSETTDTDGDGIGNNADTDDDGDGVEDSEDAFPLDPTETVDTDGDGIGNNADTDDDGDGALDIDDAFPLDPSETTDTDGDGIGNNADTDDDGDGVEDSEDAFPLDPTETVDTDGDGIGNNADTDDDGDGALDIDDAFPLDPSETTDTDGDGIGNNADTDDDGDGVEDEADNCPLLVNEDQLDTDEDGEGNVCDVDDDNDGVEDSADAFPLDPSETLDTDGDGIGNNADTDDDGDGVDDERDPAPLDASITPPTASITPSKTEGLTPELILFDGAESVAGNARNRVTSFQWQVSDDTTGDGSELNKIFSDAGNFDVTLTVTNDQDLSDSTTVQVSIEDFTGPIQLTGKILLGPLQQVDSDINQYLTDPVSNNSFSRAQYRAIPSITSGYVNEPGTGPDYTDSGNLTASGDEYDVYEINAAGGETIRLIIGDTTADLDLIVYDPDGEPVAYSLQPAGVQDEFVQIPEASGTYYVAVTPWEGASRYALSIDASGSTQFYTTAFSSEADIAVGEIIVTFESAKAGFKGAGKQLEPFSRSSYLSKNREQTVTMLSFKGNQINALRSLSNDRVGYQKFTSSTISDAEKRLLTSYLAKELATDPGVQFAEPNTISYPLETSPNDTYYGLQWHYENISLPAAWEVETGSQDVIVAVIDSGMTQHPDLVDNLAANGYDFISNPSTSGDGDGIDSDPSDPGDGRDNELCPSDSRRETSSFHGTHVGGTISAVGNNDLGVSGVSWNSKLMDLRVCGCSGCPGYSQIQAMLYAAGLPNDSGSLPDRRADIINMSLGGTVRSETVANVIQRVRDEGVIVIASSGNDGDGTIKYPASYEGVVSVGATDLLDQRSYFSTYNDFVDVAAPGGDVRVDENNDGYKDGVLSTHAKIEDGAVNYTYGHLQGTSMAAPHMSGVIALMESVTDITPADLDSILASGAITLDLGQEGYDPEHGFGLINGRLAVNEASRILTGGVVDEAPVLRVSRSNISYGSTESDIQMELRNVGTGSLQIESITNLADWLSISNPATDDGLGLYTLTVDRSDLEEGVYTDEITIISNASNTASKTILVRMEVVVEPPPAPDAGMMWINFYDVINSESNWRYWRRKSSGGDYYSFEGGIELPAGVYVIVAGTDPDNSGKIGEIGEAIGRFGGVRTPVYIVANKDVGNLELYVPYQQPIANSDESETSSSASADVKNEAACDESCITKRILNTPGVTRLPQSCAASVMSDLGENTGNIQSCLGQ